MDKLYTDEGYKQLVHETGTSVFDRGFGLMHEGLPVNRIEQIICLAS